MPDRTPLAFYLQNPHHAAIFMLYYMAVVGGNAAEVAQGDGDAHQVILLEVYVENRPRAPRDLGGGSRTGKTTIGSRGAEWGFPQERTHASTSISAAQKPQHTAPTGQLECCKLSVLTGISEPRQGTALWCGS